MSVPGRCLWHPESAAVFTCRQCNDALCLACGSAADPGLCVRCAEYRGAEAHREARIQAGHPPEPAGPRRSRAGLYSIAALLLLNLAAGVGWLLLRDGGAEAPLATRMRAAEAVSRAVEQSREAGGRFPDSLDGVVDRLPPDAAAVVRAGQILYRPAPDGRSYHITVTIRPGSP